MTSSTPRNDWLVLDAGPSIQLDRLGYVDLLPKLYQKVLLTPVVVHELRQGRGLPGATVPDLPWLEVRTPKAPLLGKVHQELGAGKGEEEAIALGLELSATVVLDDLKARRYAQRMGLVFTGTLGLLLEIHGRGLAIRSPEDELELLEQGGMRLAPELHARVLAALGE